MTSEDNSMSEVWAGSMGEEEEEEEDEEASRDVLFENSFDEDEKTYDEHECEVCQQIFISKESLDNHMKLHCVDREFKCEECSSIFLTRAHLVRHRKIHTGETIYNCEECNVSFRWKVSLHIHMRRHNNDYKRHECNLCNKYFLSRSSLKKHLDNHVHLPEYDCHKCGEIFNQKSDLKTHLQTDHPPPEKTPSDKKPTCATCHKTFSSNSSLRKHEYTHLDVKPHKCDICNVSFAQKIQLRLHNKKHNGVVDPPMTITERKEAAARERAKREALKPPVPKVTVAKVKREVRKDVTKEKPQVVPERRNAPRKARNVLQEAEDVSEMEEEEEEEDEEEEEEDTSEEDESTEEESSEEDDDEEEDDDDESQEEQEETQPKKNPWEGYRYPVCGNCNQTFKKKKALERHMKKCRRKQ